LIGVGETVCRDQISTHRKGAKMGVLQGVFWASLIKKVPYISALIEVGGSLLRYQFLEQL
jgi:hypothetical protein